MYKVILLVTVFGLTTSCAMFGKTEKEVRDEKISEYIDKLKERRVSASKVNKTQWIKFYLPEEAN